MIGEVIVTRLSAADHTAIRKSLRRLHSLLLSILQTCTCGNTLNDPVALTDREEEARTVCSTNSMTNLTWGIRTQSGAKIPSCEICGWRTDARILSDATSSRAVTAVPKQYPTSDASLMRTRWTQPGLDLSSQEERIKMRT